VIARGSYEIHLQILGFVPNDGYPKIAILMNYEPSKLGLPIFQQTHLRIEPY
jgi:hypothetical protein